jgi:hypothetical protein
MKTAQHRLVQTLLGIAMVLTMVLLPAEAMSEIDAQVEDDMCCVPCKGPVPESSSDEASTPQDNDCCPDGCHSCFLPCCAGPVSLHTCSAALGPNMASIKLVTKYHAHFYSAEPTTIYHPPRI